MPTPTGRHVADWLTQRDTVRFVVLADPLVDRLGYSARSDYVEAFWLPILGPSSVLLARRLNDWLTATGGEFELSLEQLAQAIGLGNPTGRHSSIIRTLVRLVDFGMAARSGDAYAVRASFPPLPERLRHRIPACVVAGYPHAEVVA